MFVPSLSNRVVKGPKDKPRRGLADVGVSRRGTVAPSIETAYSYLSAIEPKRTIQLDSLSIQALPTSRDSRELIPGERSKCARYP
jgi:hypothetical protein